MQSANKSVENCDVLSAELEKYKEIALEMYEHLDYCSWGDKWERECSEVLRAKAWDFFRERKCQID